MNCSRRMFCADEVCTNEMRGLNGVKLPIDLQTKDGRKSHRLPSSRRKRTGVSDVSLDEFELFLHRSVSQGKELKRKWRRCAWRRIRIDRIQSKTIGEMFLHIVSLRYASIQTAE